MDDYPRQYLYRRVVRAKLYIDAHFASADLTEMAREACFSKYHFLRLFRSVYGRTPHQYLTDVRIDQAKTMLASGSTVARACYSAGFDSIESFTHLFRRRTGHSPAEFREIELARRSDQKRTPFKFVPNCFIARDPGLKPQFSTSENY